MKRYFNIYNKDTVPNPNASDLGICLLLEV